MDSYFFKFPFGVQVLFSTKALPPAALTRPPSPAITFAQFVGTQKACSTRAVAVMDPTHRHLQIACRPEAVSMVDVVMSDILAVADVHQRVITKLSESRKVHKYFEMSSEAQHAFLHSSAAQSVTCIVSNGHKGASSQIISALPNLKLIACYGVGVDAVDLDSGQFSFDFSDADFCLFATVVNRCNAVCSEEARGDRDEHARCAQ
jgi:hypothetical protein